ncbi:T-cell surface glycoprotein CD4-like [Heteronotia binoei]|uniref:T-cell surface glycoprotein CD4-like n=1 Tax=Heteronotia binoei TaxID=13085 RepID=UPI00292FA49C|nr:T-cell surface glycoprotein CD4-like [Heteronotia binoei]
MGVIDPYKEPLNRTSSREFLHGKSTPADMALNGFLFSILLHLGTLLPVTAEQNVYSIEGSPVTLSCPDVSSNQNPGTGFWKYNGVEVLKYTNGKPWKVNQDKRFRGTDKGDFSLYMPEAQEGLYTCDVSGQEKSIRLHFLKVTGSPEGSLLQGESLELQLHPPDMTATQIEWTGPHNEKSRWNLMDNNQRLQIKNLQVQDDGLWKCSIHSLIISYRVTVIGPHMPGNSGGPRTPPKDGAPTLAPATASTAAARFPVSACTPPLPTVALPLASVA